MAWRGHVFVLAVAIASGAAQSAKVTLSVNHRTITLS